MQTSLQKTEPRINHIRVANTIHLGKAKREVGELLGKAGPDKHYGSRQYWSSLRHCNSKNSTGSRGYGSAPT